MIFVHEVHDVAGGKMAEYGEAVRTRWPRVVGERGQARLLWYWELAHGTGASYQAVSLTAVRDWAAWGDLTARAADWRREVAPLLREVTAKILLPAPWSPLADADLASEPAARCALVAAPVAAQRPNAGITSRTNSSSPSQSNGARSARITHSAPASA